MSKFAGNNVKCAVAVLLCSGMLMSSAILVLPIVAQSGQDQMGPSGGGPGGPGGRRGGPGRHLEMLQHELGLTPDQTAKVKTILDDGRAQMMAQHDAATSPEDRHVKMMADMQAENAKIKAVLTPDQLTKFDAMEARMREHRRDGGGNGEGPPPPPPPQ
jgi:Spy/CpxP family protein refolding chaperone